MERAVISVLQKWCGVQLQRRKTGGSEAEGGMERRRRRRRGYIGMYIGKEAQRYEVPLKWLGKPAVQELMRRSEDNVALLDYKIVGPMAISCSVESFDRVLFDVR